MTFLSELEARPHRGCIDFSVVTLEFCLYIFILLALLLVILYAQFVLSERAEKNKAKY